MIGVNASPQRCRHGEVESFDTVRWKTAKERRSQRSLSKSRWTFWSFTFTCDTACLAWQFEPSMQNITELKHCHDVAKCKTVCLWKANQKAIRFCVSIIFDALPGPWHEMTEGIAKHFQSRSSRSVVHTHTALYRSSFSYWAIWLASGLLSHWFM